MFRAIKQLLVAAGEQLIHGRDKGAQRAGASGRSYLWWRGWERNWQPSAAQCAQASQHPQVEAGRRRRLWAHKKLSLRRMIVLTVSALVLSAVMF